MRLPVHNAMSDGVVRWMDVPDLIPVVQNSVGECEDLSPGVDGIPGARGFFDSAPHGNLMQPSRESDRIAVEYVAVVRLMSHSFLKPKLVNWTTSTHPPHVPGRHLRTGHPNQDHSPVQPVLRAMRQWWVTWSTNLVSNAALQTSLGFPLVAPWPHKPWSFVTGRVDGHHPCSRTWQPSRLDTQHVRLRTPS